jgi:hypothetical protein
MLPKAGVKLHRMPKAQVDAILTLSELRALGKAVVVYPFPGVVRVRDSAGREHLIDPEGHPLIRAK